MGVLLCNGVLRLSLHKDYCKARRERGEGDFRFERGQISRLMMRPNDIPNLLVRQWLDVAWLDAAWLDVAMAGCCNKGGFAWLKTLLNSTGLFGRDFRPRNGSLLMIAPTPRQRWSAGAPLVAGQGRTD
jgi:hypothetical protein